MLFHICRFSQHAFLNYIIRIFIKLNRETFFFFLLIDYTRTHQESNSRPPARGQEFNHCTNTLLAIAKLLDESIIINIENFD